MGHRTTHSLGVSFVIPEALRHVTVGSGREQSGLQGSLGVTWVTNVL